VCKTRPRRTLYFDALPVFVRFLHRVLGPYTAQPLNRISVLVFLHRIVSGRPCHVYFFDSRPVLETEMEASKRATTRPRPKLVHTRCSLRSASVLVVGWVSRPSEPWEEIAEEAFGGRRAGGHDVYGWLSDRDSDTNVPSAIKVGGCEAVVIHDEASDRYSCCAARGQRKVMIL